jgi:nitronate monooxygenase
VNAIARIACPIFQAPIGSAASIELAAAVSNAGGCGSLAMTWTEPPKAAEAIRKLRELTNGLFAANFVLSFPPKALDAVLAAGVPIVTFSWGISAEHIARVHASGASVGVNVGSVAGARKAVAAGADFLSCQGLEAGGHVQSTTRLDDLVTGIRKLDLRIPLIAAGGIVDRDDVARCRDLGADGVMLGTRFLTTHESRAHPEYKSAILESGPTGTSYTWCFDGGWPYAGHRVLRNRTLEAWEAAGCPEPGLRPGEGESVAVLKSGTSLPRYHMASPVDTTSGSVNEMALYAGTGSARIDQLVSAKDVVESLSYALGA